LLIIKSYANMHEKNAPPHSTENAVQALWATSTELNLSLQTDNKKAANKKQTILHVRLLDLL